MLCGLVACDLSALCLPSTSSKKCLLNRKSWANWIDAVTYKQRATIHFCDCHFRCLRDSNVMLHFMCSKIQVHNTNGHKLNITLWRSNNPNDESLEYTKKYWTLLSHFKYFPTSKHFQILLSRFSCQDTILMTRKTSYSEHQSKSQDQVVKWALEMSYKIIYCHTAIAENLKWWRTCCKNVLLISSTSCELQDSHTQAEAEDVEADAEALRKSRFFALRLLRERESSASCQSLGSSSHLDALDVSALPASLCALFSCQLQHEWHSYFASIALRIKTRGSLKHEATRPPKSSNSDIYCKLNLWTN